MKSIQSEKGQAIVLLVFAIVGLLGFTALAIDGAMVYSDRRHAQNAADAASLAAAGYAGLQMENGHVTFNQFNCSSGNLTTIRTDAITTGENRAASNGYNNSAVTITTTCVDNGTGRDKKFIDITTEISTTTTTGFIHLFYQGPTSQQVSAVARVRPRQPLVWGNTITALGTGNSIDVGGAANLYVYGGGVFGNGNSDCDGAAHKHMLWVCQPGVTHAQCDSGSHWLPNSVNVVGSDGCKGQIRPLVNTGATPINPSDYEVPTPDCTGRNYGSGYSALPNNLSPGLYCVHGDLHTPISGQGVTIYLIDGGFHINGNSTVTLEAAVPGTETNGAIGGILFMAPHSNNSPIRLNGNADGYFRGTWLLPGMSIEKWNGTFNGEFRGQLIVLNFNMRGTFDGGMYYDTNWVYSKPTSIDLEQ